MITKVWKANWTQPSGKMGYNYIVYYDSGRKFNYNFMQNLPDTVLDFILNADICKTVYVEKEGRIHRYETYEMEV